MPPEGIEIPFDPDEVYPDYGINPAPDGGVQGPKDTGSPTLTYQPSPTGPKLGPSAGGTGPDLWTVVMLLVALGLLTLMKSITDFLNWLGGQVPGLPGGGGGGGKLSPAKATQAMSNYLGSQVSGIDAYMGSALHTEAIMVRRVGSIILRAAQVTHQLAMSLNRIESGSATARHATQQAQHRANQAQQTANIVATQTATEASRAKQSEGQLQHHIATVQQSQTHLIEPELDALKDRIPKLEKGIADAFDLLKQHEEALGIGAITAATGIALGRIGGGWIACETNQLLGNALCRNGSNQLRHLLEGALDIAALLDLCQLVGLLVDVAESSAVQDVIGTLADGIETLIQCRGLKLAVPLPQTRYAATATAISAYAMPAYG